MITITIPQKIDINDLVAIPKKEYEQLVYVWNLIPKDQLWFWTKEWQKKEREASNAIKKGRISGPYSTKKELRSALALLKK